MSKATVRLLPSNGPGNEKAGASELLPFLNNQLLNNQRKLRFIQILVSGKYLVVVSYDDLLETFPPAGFALLSAGGFCLPLTMP